MSSRLNQNMEVSMLMNPQFFNEQIRRIVVAGVIREDTAAYFVDQLTAFEYLEVGVPINVYINSGGGAVDSALAMYDAMTTCSCPIRTIGMGTVASAATLLMAAGDKGNRVLTQNCRVMIHQVSTAMSGNSAELTNEIEEVLRLQEIYNRIFAKHTGRKLAQIEKDIKMDFFMSAQQAIDYGVADRIMPTRKISINIPSPQPKQFRPDKTPKIKPKAKK